MNSTQRVIKYCAMAFAILLAVGIISSIASAVFGVVGAITGETKEFDSVFVKHNNAKTVDFSKDFEEVKSIRIENATGHLEFRTGEGFRIVGENVCEHFKAEVNGSGRLSITDTGFRFNFLGINVNGVSNPNSHIVVYVPADFIAEEVYVDTGAGNVTIEGLNTDYLYISAGAGNIDGSQITARRAKLEGGVGSVTLDGVHFEESDFDCGVGKLDIQGELLGTTNVECGVGEVNLDLFGDVNEYGYIADTGVGTIRWNGERISGKNNDAAENLIKVDGGVGSVKIDFQERKFN